MTIKAADEERDQSEGREKYKRKRFELFVKCVNESEIIESLLSLTIGTQTNIDTL